MTPASATTGRWTSLWVTALVSFAVQLGLCQFFSFGDRVPKTIDINPSNLWEVAYTFPPTGTFQVLNWLGTAHFPPPLTPFSLAAHAGPWLFFTVYAPLVATLALLAMAAFLRELECPRPAALFGGVIYAWQGDLLPFVFPAHFAYITTWPFFAIAAWAALRAERTGRWAYAVISGVGCGSMVELQPDRGAIASLLIAAIYLAPMLHRLMTGQPRAGYLRGLRHLGLCVGVAGLVTLAALAALFQGNIVGVKLGGRSDRAQTYNFVTQFSLGPAETLTYLAPGVFGWQTDSADGPYWGWIGQSADWPVKHEGMRNLNLAISTTGTVATLLGLLAAAFLLPGNLSGRHAFSPRQCFYGRLLLVLGLVALVLSWGHFTSLYRTVFLLPLMDKWRNPLKWLEITNFALITLSALGAQQLLLSLEADMAGLRRGLAWFFGAMTGLFFLAVLASYPIAVMLVPELHTDGYEPAATANIMSTLHKALIAGLLTTALVSAWLHALWRPERLRAWTLENPWLDKLWRAMLRPESLAATLAIGLAGLGAVQLGWVATKFVVPTELHELTDHNPLLDALASEGPRVRSSVAKEDPLLNWLLLNQFRSAGISCLDISAASRIPDDIGAFFHVLDDHRERLWFLGGVKNVAVPQQYLAELKTYPGIAANVAQAAGFTLIPTEGNMPSHALIQMRDYLAKATLVPHAEVLPTETAQLDRLKDPSWNPRQSILLNAPPPLPDHSADGSGPAGPEAVDLETYTPTEISLNVAAPAGGYVLINDQYDPDWQVQVNGQPAPLLRADYLMRAVQVPAGNSEVTLHYLARYHLGGIIREMTHLPVGDLSPSAEAVGLLSDGAMLAAWTVAGLSLLFSRSGTRPDGKT